MDSQLLSSSASLSLSSLTQKEGTLVENGGKTDEIQKNIEELLEGSQSLEEGVKWSKTAKTDV
jgi:hypothetical protein